MTEDRIARLTEGQRACLQLVLRGMRSKEIAIELGISPNTVNKYLEEAMRRLGAQSRGEAARMLAEHRPGLGEKFIYESDGVAKGPLSQAHRPLSNVGVTGSAGPRAAREERVAYIAPPPLQHEGFRLTLPPLGGRKNDLAGWRRITELLKVTLFLIIAFAVLIWSMLGLVQTFG